jgi:hypothetical protein
VPAPAPLRGDDAGWLPGGTAEGAAVTAQTARMATMGAVVGRDFEFTPCHYCGMPADTIDHVVPQVVLGAASLSTDPDVRTYFLRKHRVLTVDACRECNVLISSKYLPTLADRKTYLKARLRTKNRRLLAMPAWSPSELAQLSERLRNLVIVRQLQKEQIQRRLAW